jgi:hypothetical protein
LTAGRGNLRGSPLNVLVLRSNFEGRRGNLRGDPLIFRPAPDPSPSSGHLCAPACTNRPSHSPGNGHLGRRLHQPPQPQPGSSGNVHFWSPPAPTAPATARKPKQRAPLVAARINCPSHSPEAQATGHAVAERTIPLSHRTGQPPCFSVNRPQRRATTGYAVGRSGWPRQRDISGGLLPYSGSSSPQRLERRVVVGLGGVRQWAVDLAFAGLDQVGDLLEGLQWAEDRVVHRNGPRGALGAQ